ncbi:hypothetical protein HHI36_013879 [Cryptolaemus montrouzieri]|uniref:Uncharacterized protein n=1 Tax=Cryptolaemus montrouzieri TaxID=559131 RepID=A0ABD2N0T3_9CUCU
MAALYHCQRENKYKVMFLLNEEPINFPECSVGLCDWATVEQKFGYVAQNCNRDFCERGNTANIPVIQKVLLLILAISTYYL